MKACSFFNLDARWRWVVNATPRPLYPRECPGTHYIGGWVGPRACLHGCGKSCPHRDSIPVPSRYSDWAIAALGVIYGRYSAPKPRSLVWVFMHLATVTLPVGVTHQDGRQPLRWCVTHFLSYRKHGIFSRFLFRHMRNWCRYVVGRSNDLTVSSRCLCLEW
jgi:hypothetical protein